MHTLVLIVFISIIYVVIRLRSKPIELCSEAIASLPVGRFDDFIEYIASDTPFPADKEFYRKSGQLLGVVERWRHVDFVVNALQACVRMGIVSQREAYLIWLQASKQALFSIVAVPEAFVCAFLPEGRYQAAYIAAKLHWNITIRTLEICQVSGAPAAMLSGAAML